ncbi:MAG TPA: pilin, partial [Patescibacteria group bacterium]|nr:pilin [Patescibacteria group bacterium]
LAYLIWGGIRWILSRGEKEGVNNARQHIINAIIGLIVIFLSYFILNVVTQVFFGTNLQNVTTLPKASISGSCNPIRNCPPSGSSTDPLCNNGTGHLNADCAPGLGCVVPTGAASGTCQ